MRYVHPSNKKSQIKTKANLNTIKHRTHILIQDIHHPILLTNQSNRNQFQ